MAQFKYTRAKGFVEKVGNIKKIKIIDCCQNNKKCTNVLWYKKKVGKIYTAEDRKTYYYVTFKTKTEEGLNRGGIVEYCDAIVVG